MFFLYNTGLFIAQILLRFVGIFNKKVHLFVSGRKTVFDELSAAFDPSDKIIWFHCASLGEFEQGRPVIEKLKEARPQHKILVTFFSPSGYEVRKNYSFADHVCYLPLDTKTNAKKFVQIVSPELAVFIKYEFWPNFLQALQKNQVKTILISGIFRRQQMLFKSYGKWLLNSLQSFDHFFVQNEPSKKLLTQHGFNNITVSGDTRFDRVHDILRQENTIAAIAEFADGKHILVAGSTWQEGETLLISYINNKASKHEKFIIAPHTIDAKQIEKLRASFTKEVVLYSEKETAEFKNAQVLLVDTIGILTKIYSYADVAYVGGGFKTGLHNILEPATFGVPILIGPYYAKFKEAVELVAIGGCTVVNSQEEFNSILVELHQNEEVLKEKAELSKNYVKKNLGATAQILNYLEKHI